MQEQMEELKEDMNVNVDESECESSHDDQGPCYLNVRPVYQEAIGDDCAHTYFKDCADAAPGKGYVESASYIIYSDGDRIFRLNKTTGDKDTILGEVGNPTEFIEKRKIAAFYDMGYYVIGNDLFYIDLGTLESGMIFHLPEERDSDGNLREVSRVAVCKGNKLIYRNGFRTYIVDLEKGVDSAKEINLGSESYDYTIKGHYIYFVDMDPCLDHIKQVGFVVKRYDLLDGEETVISKVFGRHHMNSRRKAVYIMESEGMFEKYYYCIFGYQGVYSKGRLGFECFYVDTEAKGKAKVHRFYLDGPRIYQIQQYGRKLIYVDADKGYSLVIHDFLKDKKHVLKKKYGETEKSHLLGKLFLDKSEFQNPYKYMQLDKWIWTQRVGKWPTEIVPISKKLVWVFV